MESHEMVATGAVQVQKPCKIQMTRSRIIVACMLERLGLVSRSVSAVKLKQSIVSTANKWTSVIGQERSGGQVTPSVNCHWADLLSYQG